MMNCITSIDRPKIMTMLTNDPNVYRAELKKQLTSGFPDDWTPLWSYCELSEMLLGGQSFTFLIKGSLAKRKLIHKIWQQNTQNGSLGLGIFDLSSISVSEEEVQISLNTLFEIQQILSSDLNIEKGNNIILDGVSCELSNFKTGKTATWKAGQKINNGLKKFLKLIHSIS